jgi:hypothetical protein
MPRTSQRARRRARASSGWVRTRWLLHPLAHAAPAHFVAVCAPPHAVGSAGATTPFHYDEMHNYFAQISGQKRFRLYPPSAWRSMYQFPRFHLQVPPLCRLVAERCSCDPARRATASCSLTVARPQHRNSQVNLADPKASLRCAAQQAKRSAETSSGAAGHRLSGACAVCAGTRSSTRPTRWRCCSRRAKYFTCRRSGGTRQAARTHACVAPPTSPNLTDRSRALPGGSGDELNLRQRVVARGVH